MLVLNKALLGRQAEGARLLEELRDDKRCTASVEAIGSPALSPMAHHVTSSGLDADGDRRRRLFAGVVCFARRS